MRIAVCCATNRGLRFLEHLCTLVPDIELVVFSFREVAWEPPYCDRIRDFTTSIGGRFFEARALTTPAIQSYLDSTSIDLLFAVSWRYMIPSVLYRRARLGAFVFHDSLLPEYRGFSPTVWAMINGEKQTGATLIHMAEAVDTGDIVDQQSVPIGRDETIATVLDRVTQTYLELLDRTLPRLLSGTAPATAQDHARATYTCKRHPSDNQIDWTRPAEDIHNLIRAVTAPYPGAFTYHDGRLLRIWSAELMPAPRRYAGAIPGRVVEIQTGKGTVVLTGPGELLLKTLQYDQGESTRADQLLNQVGRTLGR